MSMRLLNQILPADPVAEELYAMDVLTRFPRADLMDAWHQMSGLKLELRLAQVQAMYWFWTAALNHALFKYVNYHPNDPHYSYPHDLFWQPIITRLRKRQSRFAWSILQ